MVLSHNDCQENNILVNLKDNEKLCLIDYEYGGWNPICMDMAIYVNECILDNAYPGANGVKLYPSNVPSLKEIEFLCK